MKAVIYCRVSGKGQEDNYSLPEQERDCRAYAEGKGYEVVAVYREVERGTELEYRPRLTELRGQIRAGEIDVVVVWHSDRLSRDQDDRVFLRVEADRHKVRYESVTDPLGDSDEDRLIAYVKGYAAKLEIRRTRERSVAMSRARVASGKLIGSGAPRYGWSWNPDRSGHVVDPNTAPTARLIFELADSGMGIRGIARELEARGIPSPKGKRVWSPTTVRDILLDESYVGVKSQFKRKTAKVEGRYVREMRPEATEDNPDGYLVLAVPPLVDPALFRRVQTILANGDRRKGQRYAPGTDPKDVLVRGFVVCASCGNRMVVARNKGEGAYLKCQTREQRRGCKPNKIVARKLDGPAWDHLANVLLDPEAARRKFVERQDASAVERLRADRTAVLAQLAEVVEQESNAAGVLVRLSAAAQGPVIEQLEALASRRAGLQSRADELAFRIRSMEGQERIVFDLLAAMDQNLGEVLSLDYDGKRARMERLGLRIEVKPTADVGPGEDRWRLSFNLPVALPARTEGRSEEAWTADDESKAEGWLAEQTTQQAERPANWSQQRERQPQGRSDSRRPSRDGDSTPRGLCCVEP